MLSTCPVPPSTPILFRSSACWSIRVIAIAIALISSVLTVSAQANTALTVYTSTEADDLAKHAARFNVAHPDIEINWVRDSTGIMTAKLLAEKNNPQADVIWGLAASSILLMADEGLLLPYAPAGLAELDTRFRDAAEPPVWVGMDAWVAAVCVNTVEAAANNLPIPQSWQALTDPVYRGHVAMPNPHSSGTGFLDVSSWLQLFGEEKGWMYMDALHKNIHHYTHSGSKPCKQAARGEVTIGISFAFRGAKSKAAGAPIEIIIPTEGVGWEMEATAIMKGTQNLAAAKTLVDWSISDDANRMYNEGYAVIGRPKLAKPVAHFPPNILSSMFDNDFAWSAKNRQRILAKWQQRYEGKSEPKRD